MSSHIKAVQGQKYISWSDQWSSLLKHYPEATYEVHENEVGDPFFVSILGIFVKVSVTIDGMTRTIHYPVLNSYNKSLKVEPYEYKTKKGIIQVPAASSFDVNTAIVRGLTKCIALFGLSLYIYRDELAPDQETVDSAQLQAIADKIKEKGISIQDVCKAWQLPKLAGLYASNFDAMMDYLEKI